MIDVIGNPNRAKNTEIIMRTKGFAYRVIPDYGNLSDDLFFAQIPSGCCDDEGNLYLACRNLAHPIFVMDKNGNVVRSFGQGYFKNPHSVRITSRKTVICVDNNSHQAVEFTLNGEHVRTFGSGKPSDSGHDPHYWQKLQIAGEGIPNDILYDNQWSFITNLSTVKRSAPPFNQPTSVAEGKDGKLFFSDGYSNASIHRFSADGKLEKTWGEPGKGPGKFTVAHGICVDKENRVWLADREGNAVHVFDDEGNLLAYIHKNLYQPTDLVADGDHVLVGERGGGITFIDMNFNIVGQLGYFNSPLIMHGMCMDKDHNLYLQPLLSYYPHVLTKLERIE